MTAPAVLACSGHWIKGRGLSAPMPIFQASACLPPALIPAWRPESPWDGTLGRGLATLLTGSLRTPHGDLGGGQSPTVGVVRGVSVLFPAVKVGALY